MISFPEVNTILSYHDMRKIFGGQTQGGIRKSKKHRRLLIIKDSKQNLYHDRWEGDTLWYTAAGAKGDQEITGNNKDLYYSRSNGYELLLFEKRGVGSYIYLGPIILAEDPKTEIQNNRTVYLFPLKLTSDDLLETKIVPEEETHNNKTRIESSEFLIDGKKLMQYTSRYERNPENREKAIEIHGAKCMVCGFDFEKSYGEIGRGFIEVHHLKPLHMINEKVEINPKTDLTCLCSNCHKMIHRMINKSNGREYTIEELKQRMNL